MQKSSYCCFTSRRRTCFVHGSSVRVRAHDLCDLFIQHHGQFQVPRTHGRLYDRWILPERPINDLSANGYLRSVVDRLNAALEAKIIHILNHKRLPLPHPAESFWLFREPWSSNPTLSKACSRESTYETTDPVSIGPSGDPVAPRSDASSCSLSIPTTPNRPDWPETQLRPDEMQVALSSKELALQIKGHTLLVKYRFEDPGNSEKKGAASG